MSIKRAIAVVNEFPIELWDDRPARDAACWPSLRDAAAGIAAKDGYVLAEEIDRTVRFVKIVDAADGEPLAVETTRDQAELVHLTLRVWAEG